MKKYYHELLELLILDPLLYFYEIDLITDGSNIPPITKQSVTLDKIGSQTYVIHYLFFNRIIEYVLSFDNDEMTIKQYLLNGHHYDEIHTNLYIGSCGLLAQRNIYGCFGRDILTVENKLCTLHVIKITKDNIEILSEIKDEITKFESYDFICRAVSDGGIDLYVAMESSKCVAYMHTIVHYNSFIEKKIVPPVIYTCESKRKKGIACELLSKIISKEYNDCYILYETAPENTASNKLAKKLGLSHLGTKYRYGAELVKKSAVEKSPKSEKMS